MKFFRLIIFSFAILFSSCAHSLYYNHSYLSDGSIQLPKTHDGKVLVVTSPEEDEKVYTQKPTSLTGMTHTVSLKTGTYLKNISIHVFSSLFKGGAEHSHELKGFEDYVIVLKPRIVSLEHQYNQLKNLGFAITPQAKINLHVTLYNPEGNAVLDKTYASEFISGGTYLLNFQPWEKVNKAIHKAILHLLVQVSHDVRGELERQTGPKAPDKASDKAPDKAPE